MRSVVVVGGILSAIVVGGIDVATLPVTSVVVLEVIAAVMLNFVP